MKIDFLYFDGCPSWQSALENLNAVLRQEGIVEPVTMIQIQDDEQAVKEKFLGSPSIRIDGMDLWYEERDSYSLSCRVYVTPDGVKGSPTIEMLSARIKPVTSS